MPRVALDVESDGLVKFHDGANPPAEVKSWRIYADFEIERPEFRRRAVLDTGAPISIFSKVAWQPFASRGQIRWVSYPPAAFEVTALRTIGLLGHRYPFRLGTIPVALRDPGRGSGRLGSVDVLAQFLEDYPETPTLPSLKYPIVLGLRHGVLERRYLVFGTNRRTDGPEAWVQDERPDYPMPVPLAVL